MTVYVLKTDIPELTSLSPEEEAKYLALVDTHRKQLAARMKNNPRGRAATIGVGLLLQYAMKRLKSFETEKTQVSDDAFHVKVLELNEVIGKEQDVTDFKYRFGEQGKPYFADKTLPFFNVSHAGGFVVLAVSDCEVGVDIQNTRSQRETNMAERFFTEVESRAVSEDETRETFYKLWSRKEALGKCTGEGVRPYFTRNMLDLNSLENMEYTWYEETISDCFLTVCVSNR